MKMKMKNTRNRAKLKENNRKKLVRSERIGEGGAAWEQTRARTNDRSRRVENIRSKRTAKEDIKHNERNNRTPQPHTPPERELVD
jgi:hypothetical protein